MFKYNYRAMSPLYYHLLALVSFRAMFLLKVGDMRKFDYIPAHIEAASDSSLVTCKEVRLKQISQGEIQKKARGKSYLSFFIRPKLDVICCARIASPTSCPQNSERVLFDKKCDL